MQYYNTIRLKDGRTCVLRNGTAADAEAVLENFLLTHGETDFLTSIPAEITMTPAQEAEYLRGRTERPDEIEIIAELDGRVVGTAGIDRIGRYQKVRHRCGFGVSVARAWWGLGIGRALTEACIACARAAGYLQMELEVVAENRAARALYESVGFVEYGRNPRGFRSDRSGWQENILMRLELQP